MFKPTLFGPALRLSRRPYRWLLICTLLAACGGGGGGGTTPPGEPTPLTVTTQTPAPGAVDVDTAGVLSFTFSEPMDAASVGSGALVLRNAAGTVPGQVAVSGATLTFAPAQAFNRLTRFEWTLSNTLRSAGGLGYGGGSGSFTTRDGRWETAATLADNTAALTWQPRLAVDAAGNAVAVWVQRAGTVFAGSGSVWSSRFDARGRSWSAATRLDNSADEAFNADVAVDAAGNALVTWQQGAGSRADLWYARSRSASAGWSAPALAETDDNVDVSLASLVSDTQGNAIVVWQQSLNGRAEIASIRFSANTERWSSPALLSTEPLGAFLSRPRVAMNAAGAAVAVWQQRTTRLVGGTTLDVLANRFDPGTGIWSGPERVEGNDTGEAIEPAVTLDEQGNAIVLWQQIAQPGATVYSAWAARWSASSRSWGRPVLIEADETGSTVDLRILATAQGSAFAYWTRYQGGNAGFRAHGFVNRFDAGTGLWSTPVRIDPHSEPVSPERQPILAADPQGNAVAVWAHGDGARLNMWANRFVAATGTWGGAALIERDDGNSAGQGGYALALDNAGNALALWATAAELRGTVVAREFR